MKAPTMGRLVRLAIRAGVPAVLTFHAYQELVIQKGGEEAALRWLMARATEANMPIIVNIPGAGGASQSVAIPPASWGEERVLGWVAGKREYLEDAFGEATAIRKFEPQEVRR